MQPTRHKLFSESDCVEVVGRIDELSALWERVEGNRFHVLGQPAYQNVSNIKKYLENNFALNSIIRRAFPDLTAQVSSFLEMFVGGRISFWHDFAVPGFHIFNYESGTSVPAGGPHYDLSHEFLFEWFGLNQKTKFNLSFTLALELPPVPCGLEYWDSFLDSPPEDGADCGSDADLGKPEFMEYDIGSICLFSGNMLHQISSVMRVPAPSRRITYQGHVVSNGENLIAYW